MKTLARISMAILLALTLALTSFALADELSETYYSLSGEHVVFTGLNVKIEQAKPGEIISLSLESDLEGERLEDQYILFTSEDVTITDCFFIMPEHNVTVKAQLAEKSNLVADLTGNNAVPISPFVVSGIMESSLHYSMVGEGEIQAYDLNGDGIADVQVIDGETGASLQRTEGADALICNYENIDLPAGPYCPYKSITFQFIKPYSVTVNVNDAAMGEASATPTSGTTGTKVTLTATPKDGYRFVEWQVVSGGVTIADDSFTIQSADVTVKAVFEAGHTHAYGTPEWIWADDYSTSKAIFTCSKGDDTKTVDATVTPEVTAATCTEAGKTVYTAKVTFDGKEYTSEPQTVPIPATGHTYDDPKWEFAADFKTATATFTCSKGDDTQTVNAAVADPVTTPTTCTEAGKTVYTAKVTFGGREYTGEKTVPGDPATGHAYGTPEWTWAADFKTATAAFKCIKCNDTQTVDATVADPVTTPAGTCTAEDTITYTATASFGGKSWTDAKAVTAAGTAVDHTYGAPEWTWAADHKTATATFKCSKGDYTQTINAAVNVETFAPSCARMGQNHFTATATLNGVTWTDERSVTFPATGHTYGTPVWSWSEDNSAATITFKCLKGDDTQTIDAAIEEPEITAATCTQAGSAVYTATATFLDETYTDEKTVELPAAGHTYGSKPVWSWAEDHTSATATFKCLKGDDTQTVDAAVTGEATADGGTKYTATANFLGETYTATVTDSPAPKHTLTVNYIDGDNNPVDDPYTEQLEEGTDYTVVSPTIDHLIPDRAVVEGTMGTADITETVTYSDDDVLITFRINFKKKTDRATQTAWRGEKTKLTPFPFKQASSVRFMGWNTKADGSGKTYADGGKITPREDVTLYAQWSQLYALSFHQNGGKGKMKSLKTNIGETVRLPACAFTHNSGYSFDCWTTKKDGTGAVYADQAKLVVSGDMTLYAQWKGKSAKVSFSANGGNGKMDQITVTTPAQIQLPECGFTRKNYVFTGWIDGNKVLHAPGETITVRNNMKLKAQWTKPGKVGFNKNKGNGKMDDQLGLPGERITLNRNTFTRDGYEFTGWNTSKNGSGTAYKDEAKFKIVDTNKVILYAQWKKKESGKLTLTPVKTISLSAKKQYLEATVTLDGQPVKGAQVTFTFHDKVKVKKTNNDGVAKFSITKSMVKKLKVGEKVEYSVTFGETTITKKAKIVE